MNCRSLYLGVIAPVCYVLAVVIGGFLRHGYSHYYNSISELAVAGSKPIVIVVVLFFIYNISLILIGVGPAKAVHNSLAKTTLRLVGLIGLLGAMMYFFPQDPRGTEMTTAGTIHFILAGLLSLLTIAVAVLAGFVFRKVDRNKLARISWILAAGIAFTGGLTATGVAQGWQPVGLLERLTIGTFLAWLAWFTLNLKSVMKNDYI